MIVNTLLLSSTSHTYLILLAYCLLVILQLVTDGYPLPSSDKFGKMGVQIPEMEGNDVCFISMYYIKS